MTATTLTVERLDAATFVDLWRQHRDAIRAYLARRLPGVADELTSETFCRAWAGRETFRPEVGPARGWLFSIAAKTLVDHLRWMGRRPPLVFVDAFVTDPADVATEAIGHVTVVAALATLPERYRLVLVLRFLFDLDVLTTAEVTGWTVPNVKALTRRAIPALREALADPVAAERRRADG